MAWKIIDGYEMVVGLEVHVELKTKTKIFCGCSTAYGAQPNTQCCPVCMGYPGTLPVLNGEAVRLAVKAGLALGCEVHGQSGHDRKNYFYPDLPKAYKISQFEEPLCTCGSLVIDVGQGEKRIGITRIHIEEDAGKLIHDAGQGTLLDCNRCGIPLIEIVSEPDVRTPQEAAAYLRKLRAILRCAGISDCRMQEGALRCDVNLSVHRPGTPFGTRTEIKNLNAFSSVQKAIEEEYRRQVEAVRVGEAIVQETRRFDQQSGKTFSMRRKENANDYRFFPEPDLPPLQLTQAQIDHWRQELPRLPDSRKAEYMSVHGLSAAAAEQLSADRDIAEYFEAALAATTAPQILANLMITEVFRLLTGEDDRIPIPVAAMARIADMTDAGEISNNTAKRLIAELWTTGESPDDCADRLQLRQVSDTAVLREWVQQALAMNPKMVEGYHGGKANLKQALMGAAMKLGGGKANPVLLRQLMDDALDNAPEGNA